MEYRAMSVLGLEAVQPLVELIWTPAEPIHGDQHREVWLRVLSVEVMTLVEVLRLLSVEDRERLRERTSVERREGDIVIPRSCAWYPILPEPADRALGYRHDEWWVFNVMTNFEREG